MANPDHVNKIKEGVSSWNEWREKNPEIKPDLGWANLVSLDLKEVHFNESNLKLAFCRDSNFTNADFSNANLYGTNFQNADLKDANFENSNLEGAHITNANLKGANLKGVNLKLANFDGSDLSDVDLIGAKKLKFKQLLNVNSLKNTKLDGDLLEQVKANAPHLLD